MFCLIQTRDRLVLEVVIESKDPSCSHRIGALYDYCNTTATVTITHVPGTSPTNIEGIEISIKLCHKRSTPYLGRKETPKK
jgi:hypothetical protein